MDIMENMPYRLQNGLYIPAMTQTRPKRRRTGRPTAFGFFSGCGGMDLGVMQAGFEVVGANEWDATAAITYMVNLGSYPINIHYADGETDKARLNTAVARNWGLKGKAANVGVIDEEQLRQLFPPGEGELDCSSPYRRASGRMAMPGTGWISAQKDVPPVRDFWFGDVRKLKGKDILAALDMELGDLDLVMGGPPCQGYSKAGRQNIADPRNNLVYEYARMICELRPKTFVMEEVPDILNFFDPDGVPVLDKFCLLLDEGGFGKYKMLRECIQRQAGAVGVLKGTASGGEKRPKAAKKDRKTEEPAGVSGQVSMFERLGEMTNG